MKNNKIMTFFLFSRHKAFSCVYKISVALLSAHTFYVLNSIYLYQNIEHKNTHLTNFWVNNMRRFPHAYARYKHVNFIEWMENEFHTKSFIFIQNVRVSQNIIWKKMHIYNSLSTDDGCNDRKFSFITAYKVNDNFCKVKEKKNICLDKSKYMLINIKILKERRGVHRHTLRQCFHIFKWGIYTLLFWYEFLSIKCNDSNHTTK